MVQAQWLTLKDDRRHQAASQWRLHQVQRCQSTCTSDLAESSHESETEIFYGSEDYYYGDGQDPENYYQEDLYDYGDDYDWWYGYGGEDEEDGEWIYEEYDDWDWYGYEAEDTQWSEPGPTSASDEKQGDEKDETGDYKGKGKGGNDGCFNCGSKWHMA